MEVDTADDNHAEGNDYGDAARNCASNSSKKKQNHLDYKIDDISRGFMCIPYSSKQ